MAIKMKVFSGVFNFSGLYHPLVECVKTASELHQLTHSACINDAHWRAKSMDGHSMRRNKPQCYIIL